MFAGGRVPVNHKDVFPVVNFFFQAQVYFIVHCWRLFLDMSGLVA